MHDLKGRESFIMYAWWQVCRDYDVYLRILVQTREGNPYESTLCQKAERAAWAELFVAAFKYAMTAEAVNTTVHNYFHLTNFW